MIQERVNEPLALCGAKSKRTGQPCRQPAMKNGRCRLHGGKSTGPKTPEGLAHAKKSNWKHGFYSAEAKEERREIRELFRKSRFLLNEVSKQSSLDISPSFCGDFLYDISS